MDKASTSRLCLPAYRQLQISHDSETESLWYYMNPKPRPTFNVELLSEIRDFQTRVGRHLNDDAENAQVRYLVLASAAPAVFNLGGDLALFVQLIENRDRDGLRSYGYTCVDAVYQNAMHLGAPSLTTISLVRGTALGGGFEAALSSNVVIAERSAQMGFPEILFNLFPGMGAYNLLLRYVTPALARRLIESGKQYGAEELHRLGIVDVLAEDGAGLTAVRRFMHQHARTRNGYQAIEQVRQRVHPLSLDLLREVVDIWVDTALRVTSRDLRTMTRLANIQYRMLQSEEPQVPNNRVEPREQPLQPAIAAAGSL